MGLVTLTFDLENGVRVASKVWTFIPNFDTLGLRVLELFAMYATDGRTDKSNAYCPLPYGRGITRYLATANRSRSALYNSPASRITEINADISRPTVETDSIQYTGCFKKVAPLKLFRIFSLRFSLFAWNFAHLLAIHIHIYLPIFVDLS